jgi:transposase-like protein
MAEPGALERGHVRLKLIRELAKGEHSQSELARRFGVSAQAISAFVQRHAERIADVASRLDDEFAGLWVAEKTNRIATYQQQIEDIAELLGDPEQVGKAGVGYAEVVRTAQAAMKAVADELGQIPAKVQVQHSGTLDVRLNGVDLGALR